MGNLMSGLSTYNQRLYKTFYKNELFSNSDDIGKLFKYYQNKYGNGYVNQLKLLEVFVKFKGNTRNADKIIEFIFKSSNSNLILSIISVSFLRL